MTYIWTLLFLILGIVIAILPRVVWNIPYMFEQFEINTSLFRLVDLMVVYFLRADAHIVSYVLGMFCGYLIRQKPNLYFGGRIGEFILWVSTTAVTFASMYWWNHFFDLSKPISYTEVLLFLAFSKFTYLCGWFWLFYACATGRGGS